jgi:CheY-like chemotaxis protein
MSVAAGGHALIIEDELILGMGMQSVLAPLGYTSFAFASTASQALEQAKLQRPDLVTVDVNLMHGTGLEAVKTITDTCGPTLIIYVTGDPSALEGIEGAVIVRKPFTPGDIARACSSFSRDPQPA